MSVVVVGLSHRTVPLDVLERMAVPEPRLPKALDDLASRDFLSEAVVLSTCHRIEVYAVAEQFHGGVQDIRNFLGELAFLPPEEFSDYLYTYHDGAVAQHLFSVAAGIESVVVGESQILGQVRHAWDRARQQGTCGPRLSALFRHALEAGKRARSETAVSRGITSLSQAAVAMARDRLGSLTDRRVLVLGAGEMGEEMAMSLAAPPLPEEAPRPAVSLTAPPIPEEAPAPSPPGEVIVANRSWARASELASRVGGRPVRLSELPTALLEADALLASTASPGVVVEHADLAPVMERRGGRPLLIIDLAMPRDIDPSVAELAGVTLLDLGDLRAFVDARLDERRQEVERVRDIVAEEVERFTGTVSARQMAPTVTALRGKAEAVRVAEIARYRARLEGLDPAQREAVDALTKSMLAKVLHDPTVRLKDTAGTARGDRLADAIRELFGI